MREISCFLAGLLSGSLEKFFLVFGLVIFFTILKFFKFMAKMSALTNTSTSVQKCGFGPNITYKSSYLSTERCNEIFAELEKYPFEKINLKIHGRTYHPLQKSCAYADPDIYYSFSGSTLQPKPWTPLLMELKSELENELKCEFNYVLVNYYESGRAHIGLHKDDESSLDKSVPIATLSFGAPRTMTFCKRGKRTFYQPLENGSLLQLHDQLWSHAIPTDVNVKKPRISLTFWKINTAVTDSNLSFPDPHATLPTFIQLPEPLSPIHPHDPNETVKRALDEWEASYAIPSTPSKKPCLDIPCQDWLTSLAQDMDLDSPNPTTHVNNISWHHDSPTCVQDLNSPKSTTRANSDTRDLKKFWISTYTAVSVQVFKSEIFVHIREYYESQYTKTLLPSKTGVCLDLPTFFDLGRKIFNFANTLLYASESCIINNCVIALVEDRHLHLRPFNSAKLHNHQIALDIEQLQNFRMLVCDIDDFIIDFMFCDQLKSKVCVPTTSSASMDTSFQDLKKIVEQDLAQQIHPLFICPGCQMDSPGQASHDCLSASDLYKYDSMSPSVRMLCNITNIAKNFLNTHNKLCSKQFNFEDLYKNMFSSI